MKIVRIFVLIVFLSLFTGASSSAELLDLNFSKSRVDYTFGSYKNCEGVPRVTTLYDLNIYQLNDINLNDYKNIFDIVSESVKVHTKFKKDFLLDNKIKTKYVERYENFVLYYCYKSNFPKSLQLRDFVFNLQIAVYENSYKIGYPAIIESF